MADIKKIADNELIEGSNRTINDNFDALNKEVAGKASTASFNTHKAAAVLDHPDNSVTDEKIGKRTIDIYGEFTPPSVGEGYLSDYLTWFAQVLKSITGQDDWYLSATRTIRQLSGDIANGVQALNTHKVATVLDHPDNSVADTKIGDRTIPNPSTDSGDSTARLTSLLAAISSAIRTERAARTAADVALSIPAGRVDQYFRGDKTWASFLDSVQRSKLSYLDVPSNWSKITQADDVVTAFGKLQAQINSNNIVICDGTDDNFKIQAAINAAPDNERTVIRIIGTANMSQTSGGVFVGSNEYEYYLKTSQNKDIVLDFSGCKSVTVNSATSPQVSGATHVVFYAPGKMEIIGLDMSALIGGGNLDYTAAHRFIYSDIYASADITLRNCKHTTISGARDTSKSHYGIETYGNVYLYNTNIDLAGFYSGQILAMPGNNTIGLLDGCTLKSIAWSGSQVATTGSNNVLNMHNSKITTSAGITGGYPVATNASGLLLTDSCTIIGGNDGAGGAITMYNGEIRNCSIAASGNCAMIVNSGGTRGGTVIANNILYNNKAIVNNAGTNTFMMNNATTIKAMPG